jgi:hypothetical protein
VKNMKYNMYKELPRPVLKRMRLAFDNYQCTECGTKQNLTIHHRVPKKRGGPDTLANTIIKCRECHINIHFEKKMGYHRNKKKLRDIKARFTREELHPKQDMDALILFFLWLVWIAEQNLELILSHPYSEHVRSWEV